MRLLHRIPLALLLAFTCVFQLGAASPSKTQIGIETVYSQTDSKWASQQYAFNPNLTIASDGCALTCMAMLLSYYGREIDPPGLNDYMKKEGLFAYDPHTKYNDYVNWQAPVRYSQGKVNYKGMSGDVDSEIENGRPVIVKVHTSGISMHFVLVIGKDGEIVDPLGGTKTTLRAKGYKVDGYRFYSGVPASQGNRPNETEGQADQEKENPNKIIIDHGGWLQATIISSEAYGNAEFGKRSPNPFALFADSKVIGANKTVGYFSTGTELVFYINATFTSETYLSTDSAHCRIEKPSAGTWVLSWEDWTDNDFNDFVIRIEYGTSAAQSGDQQIFQADFEGVTSEYYTNIRSGPGLNNKVVGQVKPNTKLAFDAYTYGTGVTDIWLGTLDYRWYRIKGTEIWIASAVVKGNAPSSTPSGPVASQTTQASQGAIEVSQKAYNAVEWAKLQVNKEGFPLVGSNKTNQSSGWCARFVANAYGSARAGVPTAKILYQEMKGIGAVRNSGEPQYGALVFFEYGELGHVGIYIGDGKAVSAGNTTIEEHPYNKFGNLPYLGWSPPPERWIGRK